MGYWNLSVSGHPKVKRIDPAFEWTVSFFGSTT